ncbi:RNA-guided endonuclease InsQ/TnpB family protein [Coleofasciculus chthonoplastes]|nr:transposase [Coleofasciculus chthonoplastes]
MKLTHIYRIKPSAEQVVIMDTWLEMLRRHHNYSLGQKFDWLRRTRCQIDRCSLFSEPIGDIPDKFPGYNFQVGELKKTKELFPAYKEIHAEVQQQNLKRLDKSWDRWIRPDKSGKRAGMPKFKKKGQLRSFTFPRINCPKAGVNKIENGVLTLSKIGSMPVIMHRPFPDGFELKTATIVKKADGWYVVVSLEDSSVPTPLPVDEIKSFSFSTFLRIFGLVVSVVGLTIAMRGLFLPWFSISSYSVVTGLDFWVHGDSLTILSYSLAWIVFLTYCFQPNYVSYCAICFSLVIPIFYFKSWVLLLRTGNPYDFFDYSSYHNQFGFRFTLEPGFWNVFMGMSLILLGVFIGMNNQNRIIYMFIIIVILYLLGLLIGMFLIFN